MRATVAALPACDGIECAVEATGDPIAIAAGKHGVRVDGGPAFSPSRLKPPWPVLTRVRRRRVRGPDA